MASYGKAIVSVAPTVAFLWAPAMCALTLGLAESWQYLFDTHPGGSLLMLTHGVSYASAGAMAAAAAAVTYARGPGRRFSVVAGFAAVSAGMAVFDPAFLRLPTVDLFDHVYSAGFAAVFDTATWELVWDMRPGIMESTMLTVAGGSVIAFHGGGMDRRRLTRFSVVTGVVGTAALIASMYLSPIFILLILPPFAIAGCVMTGLVLLGYGAGRGIMLVPALLVCWHVYIVTEFIASPERGGAFG